MSGKHIITFLALCSAVLVSGCVSNLEGDTYTREEAMQTQRVRYGIIEETRMVIIEGTQSGAGGVAGSLIGGIAGSTIGHGRGSAVGAIAGAVAGGVLGNMTEEATTRKQGVELIIRIQGSDELIAVVQEHNPEKIFKPGDAVRLMTVGGTTRVAQ